MLSGNRSDTFSLISEINPYQPPETDVEAGWNPAAYRDGYAFMVKAGYVAPRVCYLAGLEEEEDAKPFKVRMPVKLGVQFYIFLGVIGRCMSLIRWDEYPKWVTFLGLAIVCIFGPTYGSFSEKFYVFYEKKLRRKYFIKSIVGNTLGAVGLALMINYSFSDEMSDLIIGLVMIVVSFPLLVKQLRSKVKVGEYARYEGAHKKFLEALPVKEVKFSERFLKAGLES